MESSKGASVVLKPKSMGRPIETQTSKGLYDLRIAKIPTSLVLSRVAAPMEKGAKVYFHYNHTDACRLSRWTTRYGWIILRSLFVLWLHSWWEILDSRFWGFLFLLFGCFALESGRVSNICTHGRGRKWWISMRIWLAAGMGLPRCVACFPPR